MDLRLDDLTVTIDGRDLVHRLDLTVPTGSLVGLVGPNGSGKSTALRCVYRALAPTGGAVYVGPEDVQALSLAESARRLAAVTQDSGSDLDFTVAETVALGRSPHVRGNSPFSDRDRAICHDAMARMEVLHLVDRGVLALSGGERQRVSIARALAQQTPVLVLDEPTNHLDIRHQWALLTLLAAVDVTTLLVLHDLSLAAAVCDRVAVLDRGRLVAAGPPIDIFTPQLVRDVFGVDAVVVPHPTTGAPHLLLGPAPPAQRHSPPPSSPSRSEESSHPCPS